MHKWEIRVSLVLADKAVNKKIKKKLENVNCSKFTVNMCIHPQNDFKIYYTQPSFNEVSAV